MVTYLLIAALLVLILTYLYDHVIRHYRKYGDIPSVSGRWPLLGNVFDMTKTHLVLTEWAKTYGHIFRFSLYGEEIVVLNSYEAIYDALVTKGCDFSGRPRMKRTDYNDRNEHSIVWQTYTPKLQFLRKQIHSSLRMYGDGLGRLQDRCEEEMKHLLGRIDAYEGEAFDPWDLFYDSACNIMLDLSLGVRFPYDGENLTRMKEINELFNHSFGPGNSRILDGLPWLHYLQHSEHELLKKALRLRDEFWLDHKPESGMGSKDAVIKDLKITSEVAKYRHYQVSDTTLKETFTNLILAGTDTTTTALTCFLLLLIHYPEVQNTLHAEVDKEIGKSRAPQLSDRPNLPYLEGCLLETLRLISHVPLAVPHSTVCDTDVCGKKIPENTTVYINLWSLHHDETVWTDPWCFNPHRFLTEDGKLVPAHHENRRRLMAFGAGRRVCLGEALAKNRLFLFTASLLQRFSFSADKGKTLPELDPRKFTLGIVLHPERFNVIAKLRSSSNDACILLKTLRILK